VTAEEPIGGHAAGCCGLSSIINIRYRSSAATVKGHEVPQDSRLIRVGGSDFELSAKKRRGVGKAIGRKDSAIPKNGMSPISVVRDSVGKVFGTDVPGTSPFSY